MSKPFTYWVRLAMVATMCTLVTFSPVSAGRWMDRLLHRDACKTQASNCCESASACEPACFVAPLATCQSMSSPSASSCCDEMPVDRCGCGVGMDVPATPVVQTPALVVEKPAPVVEKPAPVVEKPAPVVVKPAPVIEKPAPVVAEPVPIVPDPKTVLDPVDAPAAQQPAVEPEMPAKPAPKSDIDDLFGNEPAPAIPAERKATKSVPQDSTVDDLFGADPKPVVPATPTVEPSADDLFGSDPIPAKPATPVAEPSIDDLFGSDPKPVVPATPTVEPSADDLFGSDPIPAKPATPAAEPSIDDLFGSDPKPAAPVVDDLFGTDSNPAGKPIATEVDASEKMPDPASIKKPGSEKKPVDVLDELFGVGMIGPASEFNGAEYRGWVDNSGAYRVNARLAVIYVDKIKLLKENGKFTTVPLSRLSDADFAYVSWVASNLTNEQTAKMVKSEFQETQGDISR